MFRNLLLVVRCACRLSLIGPVTLASFNPCLPQQRHGKQYPWILLRAFPGLPLPPASWLWLTNSQNLVTSFLSLSHTHPYTASLVASVFIKVVYKLHGLPASTISDRDPMFTCSFWQSLFKLSGVTLKMSSSYHPQTDGQIERLNHYLETFLHCFVHACPKKWKEWLPAIEFWYNTSFHSALGRSPFEALFGRQPHLLGLDPTLQLKVTLMGLPRETQWTNWFISIWFVFNPGWRTKLIRRDQKGSSQWVIWYIWNCSPMSNPLWCQELIRSWVSNTLAQSVFWRRWELLLIDSNYPRTARSTLLFMCHSSSLL
jgi:hypothetical protein